MQTLQGKLTDKNIVVTQLEEKLHHLSTECDHLKSMNDELQQKEAILNNRISKLSDVSVKETQEDNGLVDEGKSRDIEVLKRDLAESRRRERETGEVVKKLMKDAEEIRKQGGKTLPGDVVSVLEMERKLDQTTVELDEKYGHQIVQMKEELMKQFQEDRQKLEKDLSKQNEDYQTLLAKFNESEKIQMYLQQELEQFIHSDSDRTEDINRLSADREELLRQIDEKSVSECALRTEKEELAERLDCLQKQILDLKESVDEKESLEIQLEDAREQNRTLLESLQKSEDKMLEMETALEENEKLSKQLEEAERKISATVTEMVSDKEIQDLRRENSKLTEENQGFKGQILNFEEQQIHFQKEKEKMALELDQMNEEFEQMSQQARKYELKLKEVEDLTIQLDSLQHERQVLRTQNDELKNKINLQNDSLISQKSQLKEATEENSVLKSKVGQIEQENEILKTSADLREVDRGHIQEMKQDLERKVEDLKEAQGVIQGLKEENSICKEKISVLEGVVAGLTDELDNSKIILTKKDSVVANMTCQIEESDQERKDLKSQLAEKIDCISVLEKEITEKESEAENYKMQLEKLTVQQPVSETIVPVSARSVAASVTNDSNLANDSNGHHSMEGKFNLDEILEQVVMEEIVPSQNSTVSAGAQSDVGFSVEDTECGSDSTKPFTNEIHVQQESMQSQNQEYSMEMQPHSADVKETEEVTTVLEELKVKNKVLEKEVEDLKREQLAHVSLKLQIDSLNESLQLSCDSDSDYQAKLCELQQCVLELKTAKDMLSKEVEDLNENSFSIGAEIQNLRENVRELENERMTLVNKLDTILIERDNLVTELKENVQTDIPQKFDDSLEDNTGSDESRDIPKCSSLNDSLEDYNEDDQKIQQRDAEETGVRGNSEMVRNCMPTLDGHLFSSERSSLYVGQEGACALSTDNASSLSITSLDHVQSGQEVDGSGQTSVTIEATGSDRPLQAVILSDVVERSAEDDIQHSDVAHKLLSFKSHIKQLEQNLQSNAVERSEILSTMENVSSLCERLRQENETLTNERNKLKQDHDVFKESLCQVKDELDNKVEELDETIEKLMNVQSKYDDVKASYDSLQDHYDVLGDENHSLRIDYDELLGKYDAIVLENEGLSKSVQDSEILSSKIFSESEELMLRLGELETVNDAHQSLKERHQAIEEECEALKCENFEVKDTCDQLQKQNEEIRRRLESIEEELCKVSAKNQSYWEKVDQLTRRNSALEEEVSVKTIEVTSLSSQACAANKALESLKEERIQLMEKLKEFENRASEKDKLKSENENIRSQLRMITMEMTNLKSENGKLMEKVNSSEEQVDSQRQKFEEKMLQLVEDNGRYMQQVEEGKEAVQQSQRLISELTENLECIQVERKNMKENVDSLNIQVEEFCRMRNDLEEKMKVKERNFMQERTELEERIDSLNIQAEEFMRMRRDLEERLNRKLPHSGDEKSDQDSVDAQSLKEKFTSLEKTLAEKCAKFDELVTKFQEIAEENEKLQGAISEKNDSFEVLENKVQQMKIRLGEREEFIDVLSSENESLKYTIQESKSRISELGTLLSEKEDDIRKLNLELSREMEHRINEKNQTIDQLKEDIQEIRSHIQEKEVEKDSPSGFEESSENLLGRSSSASGFEEGCESQDRTSIVHPSVDDAALIIESHGNDVSSSVQLGSMHKQQCCENGELDDTQHVSVIIQNLELRRKCEELQQKIHSLELDKNYLKGQVRKSIQGARTEDEEQMEAIFEENCRLMDEVQQLNSDLASLRENQNMKTLDNKVRNEKASKTEDDDSEHEFQKLHQQQRGDSSKSVVVEANMQTESFSESNLKEDNNILQNEVKEKTEQVEKLSSKILTMAEDFVQLKLQYTSLLTQVKEEAERTKNTASALVESMNLNVKLQEEVSSLQGDLATVVKSRSDMDESLQTVEKSVSESESHVGELERIIDQDGTVRDDLKSKVEELEQLLVISRSSCEDMVRHIEEKDARCGRMHEENCDLMEKLQDKENNFIEMNKRCEELSNDKDQMEEVIVKVRAEKRELSSNCRDLSEKIKTLEAQNQDLVTKHEMLLASQCDIVSQRDDLKRENEILTSDVQMLSEFSQKDEDGQDKNSTLQGSEQIMAKKEAEMQELWNKNRILVEENDELMKIKDVFEKVKCDFEKVKKERDELMKLHDTLSEDLNDMQTKYEAVRSLMDDTKKECNNEIEKLRGQLSTVNLDVTGLKDTLQCLEMEMASTVEQKSNLMTELEEEQSRRQEVVAEHQRLKEVNDKFNKDLQNQRKANESLLSNISTESVDTVEESAILDSSTEAMQSMSFMSLTFDASTQTNSESSDQQSLSQLMTDYESRVLELSNEVDSLRTEYDDLKFKHENETIELQKRIDQIKCTGALSGDQLELEIPVKEDLVEEDMMTPESMVHTASEHQTGQNTEQIDDSILNPLVPLSASEEEVMCDIVTNDVKSVESQSDISLETHDFIEKAELEVEIEKRCKEKLLQSEYELEEKYAFELRDKQSELMDQLEKEKADIERRMERTLKQREQTIQAEKHREFVKALQQMKKDFAKRLKAEKQKHKQREEKRRHSSGGAVEAGKAEEEGGGHQKGADVQRLKSENQVGGNHVLTYEYSWIITPQKLKYL